MNEPDSFSIDWFYNDLAKGSFTGRFFVMGKGEVYVYHTEDQKASIRDVYTYGRSVGVGEMM